MARVFKVWVRVKGNTQEDAFEVDCSEGMNIDSLKKAIVAARNLPVAGIGKIYPSNLKRAIAFRPGFVVVEPAEKEVGSSDDLPYYFSIGKLVSYLYYCFMLGICHCLILICFNCLLFMV